MSKQREYGDFQTPAALASLVVRLLQEHCEINPRMIIEPTCGLGSFVLACFHTFHAVPRYYAFDINPAYLDQLQYAVSASGVNADVNTRCQDFFTHDWAAFFQEIRREEILIIGNPPWVTNAGLSTLNSINLPVKSNFQGHRGFDAKTGKANFDIAEWMLIELLNSLQNNVASLAMLCKTATARKVLHYAWRQRLAVSDTSLHTIDAKTFFGVSVDACLFVTHIGKGAPTAEATVYRGLNFIERQTRFGLDDGELIANLDEYQQVKFLRGTSPYTWRSGIKHDASKVMELTYDGTIFVNGFGEHVEFEPTYIFPLLKSSDLTNKRLTPRKYVLVPQTRMGETTESIRITAPHTWAYLLQYAHILDNRKSSVYQQRPRFSIFGVGDYSFTPWKVAIAGLYNTLEFVVIGNETERPVMLDDTCYFLSCATREEADFLATLLNSEICQRFLQSIIFFDAKRPITKDILQRINLRAIAQYAHLESEAAKYFP